MQLTVFRQDDAPPPMPTEIAPVAVSWRDGLSNALAPHGVAPFSWEESLDCPYFTDKPAWDCYSALMVWASHHEHPESPLPAVAPKEWSAYRPFIASQEGGKTRFPHLLRNTELWIPTALSFTFMAEDITGNKVGIGSVNNLKAELEMLNQETWQVTSDVVSGWRRDGADFGAPLEVSARFAFSIFLELAGAAVAHRLPMKLDY
jgi:hypothetical protein